MNGTAGSEFSFVVETPDGRLPQMRVRVPEESIGLADVVPFMHNLADAVIGLAVTSATKGGERVTCGPGCGVCCSQLVPVSAPEVLFIVQRLMGMPLAERSPILQRFEAIEKRTVSTGLKQRICDLSGAGRKNDIVARDYFRLGEPCPFLASQSCSIHAWRPVVCREFNSLSDPALCADPFVNKLGTVPLYKRPSSILAVLASRVAGISTGLVAMPLLFDWYEANKELAQKTWPADMLIKKLLAITVEPAVRS
jgi:Fe-S-cluster containining protein